MKVKSSIERGAQYLCTKLGDVVTAIEQVAVVKGMAMWEVERMFFNIECSSAKPKNNRPG
jgi:hypothetical protein